jgi:hypothetical protein
MAAPKAVGAIWITQISFVKDHLMIIHVRYTCNLNLDYIKLFLAVSQNLEKLFTHLPTHVYFKHYPAIKKKRYICTYRWSYKKHSYY